MEAVVKGIRISYLDIGQGTPLLFLHGWGAQVSLYRALLDPLATRFRVIAPDLPGVGTSQEPPVPWHTGDYVDFVHAFLGQLGITSCKVMGHSHGGRMILNWLSRQSQPIVVTQAVLCSAAGLPPPRGFGYYYKVYTYKLGKLLLTPFPTWKERLSRKAGSADYQAASPVMRNTLTCVVNENYTKRLPLITVSTLLLWGELDTATPLSHGQCMADNMKDAGLVILKGGTHFAILEQSAYVLRILEAFWK